MYGYGNFYEDGDTRKWSKRELREMKRDGTLEFLQTVCEKFSFAERRLYDVCEEKFFGAYFPFLDTRVGA